METSPRRPGLAAPAAILVLGAFLALPLAAGAQYVPPPPPPTCVENCDGAPANEPPPSTSCREIVVRYVCGTKEVCQDFGQPKGIVCVDVEEWCEKSSCE